MSVNLSTTIHGWLNKLNIPVSRKYIHKQLNSHPDYPSLLSITDTLSSLGIDNVAVQIEKDQLHEVATPFIAHLRTKHGEFVVVQNRDTLNEVYPGFFESWDGVVVVAERNETWSHKENSEWLKKERTGNIKQGLLITLGVLCAAFIGVLSNVWIIPSLIFIAIAGVFISWLSVSQELGIENVIAEQVCGKQGDCDAVIKSEKAKLPFGVSLGDLSFIWFSCLLVLILLSTLALRQTDVLKMLSILSIMTIPATFFSFYYQWRVIKKSCRLCLITVGLLWLQFATLFTTLINNSWESIDSRAIFFTAIIFTLIGTAWFYIKRLLVQNKELEEKSFAGTRFKKNETVFKSILEKQRKVDTTPWQYDLQLGNAAAAIQIMVACNPFCRPCALIHEKFHEILERLGEKMGLTIRFSINAKSENDRSTQAVQYILQKVIAETGSMTAFNNAIYTRQLLHDWFRHMNFEKFQSAYPLSDQKDVSNLLRKHDEWADKSEIAFTPTIFINGYESPKSYSPDSLMEVLTNLITSNEEFEKVERINTDLVLI